MNDNSLLLLVRALDDAIGADGKRLIGIPTPTRGWLRAVREVFGLTQRQVAKKLGMKQQPYAEIEARETAGTVTLETMRKAAHALDCELVCFLVPKGGSSFKAKAHDLNPAFGAEAASEHSMALEEQGMIEIQER